MRPQAIFTAILLLLVSGCSCERDEELQCDEQAASTIGKLSYISNPLFAINNWSELESYVVNNSESLQPDSKVIRCMEEIGLKMQNSALQNFDAQAGDIAHSNALSMGATGEMANQIQSNIENDQIQPFVMGQDLVWLSQVIPKGAQGDWSAFLEGTFIRNQQIEYIRTMVAMFQYMGEAELLDYLMSTMDANQPYIEYQTAVIVWWYSN